MLLQVLKRHGIAGIAKRALRFAARKSGWESFRHRNAQEYRNPTDEELKRIEAQLLDLGIGVSDYYVDTEAFQAFVASEPFPADYHGGKETGVWEEKHLEHFVAAQLLQINDFGAGDLYVDVAACNSPWASVLRTRQDIEAYAIDLDIGKTYRRLPYYRKEDATSTQFADAAVRGASLHCAFEMFMGDDDTKFIREAARILRSDGKLVILPLYMHTHYCAYSTPEYWGKGFSDPMAIEYVRRDCYGVPSSRKYDAASLKRRVLEPAVWHGFRYRLLALRNKKDVGRNIYCHFILELCR